MATQSTARKHLPTPPSAHAPEPAPETLDSSYLESLVEAAGGAQALVADGVESDYVQPVDVEKLLGAVAPEEVVSAVLAIRQEHLETFWRVDNTAFQSAVTGFIADRPFLTVDDAMRAVLRSFGVRAKLLPDHAPLGHWDEQGWQLVETDVTDLSQARVLT
ncbi:hypothetical protein GCM10011374_38970 [Kocuria dechangensis]|uniref:Uncharacterized protein n=1 Tax=Kocuria dechangensis TaxID=1176249 RepID=A0A917M076_9MICC|nr:hypothetical protein [Kocuria dechangensis]GGG70605.1 hypothetical protein GCM10011374_38970 [Kocuria dechangensis]